MSQGELSSKEMVSVPRELLGEVLNVLGNAASIWPNPIGAASISRLQLALMAAVRPVETSARRLTFLVARLGTIRNIAERPLSERALPEIARLSREALEEATTNGESDNRV